MLPKLHEDKMAPEKLQRPGVRLPMTLPPLKTVHIHIVHCVVCGVKKMQNLSCRKVILAALALLIGHHHHYIIC